MDINIDKLEKKIDEIIKKEFSLQEERMEYGNLRSQPRREKRNYREFQSLAR